MMKAKLLALVVLSIVCGANLATIPVSAADIKNCEKNVGLLNYRSDLLGVYRKNEDRDYRKTRQLWATRINYAGQWVKKDAEKARDALYQYDALHAATMKEVDKQIKAYEPLKKDPLDCSKTDQAVIKAKINELKGWKNKKAVSGNALLTATKKNESTYSKGDFKKATDAMIDKLHKEKRKNPQPLNTKLDVKNI